MLVLNTPAHVRNSPHQVMLLTLQVLRHSSSPTPTLTAAESLLSYMPAQTCPRLMWLLGTRVLNLKYTFSHDLLSDNADRGRLGLSAAVVLRRSRCKCPGPVEVISSTGL